LSRVALLRGDRDTEEEALQNLQEALELYMETVLSQQPRVIMVDVDTPTTSGTMVLGALRPKAAPRTRRARWSSSSSSKLSRALALTGAVPAPLALPIVRHLRLDGVLGNGPLA
jgi:CheY-like chemotaxis protein